MDEETYIAVVKIHDQPPFDTAAVVRTHAKTFHKSAPVREVWNWAMSHRHGEYNTIASLEIRPNE